MILLASGSDTGKDINAAPVLIPLNGTATNYANSSATKAKHIKVIVQLSSGVGIAAGATITWNIKVGRTAAASRILETITQVAQGGDHPFQTYEIILSLTGGEWSTLKIDVQSDNVADTGVAIETEVWDISVTDENGRVNVGSFLDEAVTLTNDKLDTNPVTVGGVTPIPQSDIDAIPKYLVETTVDTGTSNTEFVINDPAAFGSIYKGMAVVMQGLVRSVKEYLADGTVTLNTALYTTPSPGDPVKFSPNGYIDPDILLQIAAVPADVWDRIISKANHNIAQSAGKQLREANLTITADDAQSGTLNTIVLATGASSVDGAYDPARVFIAGGTGVGQSRNIIEYVGATRSAIVDRNWKVIPDNTSEYIIVSDGGREHVNEGLARAGTSDTIQLNALASTGDDAYKNQLLFIRSGTGDDQVKRIKSYVGSTQIATVSSPWVTVPDATSGYVMLPMSCVEVQAIKDQELSEKSGQNLDTFFSAGGADTVTKVDDINTVDTVLDKSNAAQWQIKFYQKGTSNLLATKDWFDHDGDPMISASQIPGNLVEASA